MIISTFFLCSAFAIDGALPDQINIIRISLTESASQSHPIKNDLEQQIVQWRDQQVSRLTMSDRRMLRAILESSISLILLDLKLRQATYQLALACLDVHKSALTYIPIKEQGTDLMRRAIDEIHTIYPDYNKEIANMAMYAQEMCTPNKTELLNAMQTVEDEYAHQIEQTCLPQILKNYVHEAKEHLARFDQHKKAADYFFMVFLKEFAERAEAINSHHFTQLAEKSQEYDPLHLAFSGACAISVLGHEALTVAHELMRLEQATMDVRCQVCAAYLKAIQE